MVNIWSTSDKRTYFDICPNSMYLLSFSYLERYVKYIAYDIDHFD